MEEPAGRMPSVPKDAATVVLLREAASGRAEVFLVRRHTRSGFMGGAHVFPGGKLDAADRHPRVLAMVDGRTGAEAARALGEPDNEQGALGLYVAALRETFEEAGILLADTADGCDLAAARQRLAAGEPFAEVMGTLAARLQADKLLPWARWVTPAAEPRRYDTRFFLGVVPPEQTASHDRRETTDGAWMTPAEALERQQAGAIELPPPTLRSLELLSEQADVLSILHDAQSRPPPFVDPVFFDEGGQWVLALPGDRRHPTRARAIGGPTRFILNAGRWQSDPRSC